MYTGGYLYQLMSNVKIVPSVKLSSNEFDVYWDFDLTHATWLIKDILNTKWRSENNYSYSVPLILKYQSL